MIRFGHTMQVTVVEIKDFKDQAGWNDKTGTCALLIGSIICCA